jgi:hypothetical protein
MNGYAPINVHLDRNGHPFPNHGDRRQNISTFSVLEPLRPSGSQLGPRTNDERRFALRTAID